VSTDADRLVAKLLGRPELAWEVGHTLARSQLAGPWERYKVGRYALRNVIYPRSGPVHIHPLAEVRTVFTEYHTDQRPQWSVFNPVGEGSHKDRQRSGRAATIGAAMVAADEALREFNWIPVGTPPMIALAWAERANGIRVRRSANDTRQILATLTVEHRGLEEGGFLVEFTQGPGVPFQIPIIKFELDEATGHVDELLKEHGWWLL